MIERFIWDVTFPPISFYYDGKSSKEFISKWNRKEAVEKNSDGIIRQFNFTDPVTRLSVTAHIQDHTDFPSSDWVLEFVNNGVIDTPIIEEILPLDVAMQCNNKEKIFLHYAKGSDCRMDDFLPVTDEISPGRKISLKPVGGRSSNGVLPFMNLQRDEGGFILAIGWSGQWLVRVDRNENNLHVSSGMEKTHFILHAGEKIRTPRILLINWDGKEPVTGNNLLRKIILTHYSPRMDSELIMPSVAFTSMPSYYKTKKVSESSELKAVEHASKIGVETYWIDACWYGSRSDWREAGDWKVRKDAFPNGLKPVSDSAHHFGMKFLLWFEPERVGNGTEIEQRHPEFLIRSGHNPDYSLFNLGLPEARFYITDVISKNISDSKVDIYRQDFNLDPLPYWQAADLPDRIGITEMRHIEGLYLMWDELRRRHSGLAIDNCASGGRRIDLETVSRSFPLWRSDFSDITAPAYGRGLQIGDQIQTAGLSLWVPLHTGAVWTFTPYDFRSAMSTGIVLYSDICDKDFPVKDAENAIAELKRLRHYFLGDFYPLLPVTSAFHDWCAYQYHRPDLDEGFAVFLRRHESPFISMEVALHAIDMKARYKVEMTTKFDESPQKSVSGEELAKIKITISDKPGSVLLIYSKL